MLTELHYTLIAFGDYGTRTLAGLRYAPNKAV